MATEPPSSRSRGRPRRSDCVNALEAATRVFWARGYEQAPIELLCREMEMPKASVYQLFESKERLFLAAVSHYAATRLKQVSDALGPTGDLTEDLGAFFENVVLLSTSDATTPGCLISSVLAEVAVTNAAFQPERDRRFDALEARIKQRFQVDGWPGDGSCPAGVAASLTAAMARGIVSRARSGQSAAELRPVGAAAVAALTVLRG